MFRIEQGLPARAYIDNRTDDDPLVLFADHIHHGHGRRRADDALVRIEKPSPQMVEESHEWKILRETLSPTNDWNVEREEHPEWPQVAIWIAARTLVGLADENGAYERLTILSYPSMSREKIEAYIAGDYPAADLLVATAVVGALKKQLAK